MGVTSQKKMDWLINIGNQEDALEALKKKTIKLKSRSFSQYSTVHYLLKSLPDF